MEFNITKPSDMISDPNSVLSKYIEMFESKLQNEEKDQPYYHLVIVGEIPRHICDKIEEVYRNGGWGTVKCCTSSEKGERAGLTGLQLWFEKINQNYYDI